MGAKYLPNVKDQKANLRYQGKQNPGKPGFKKPASTQPAATKTSDVKTACKKPQA